MKVTRPTFLQYNDTAKPLTEKQVAKAVESLKTKIWVGTLPAKFLAGESCTVVGDMWHGYTETGLAKQRKSKSGSDRHLYSQYTMQIVDTKTVTLTNNKSSLTVFSFDNKRERDAFLKDTISNCIEVVEPDDEEQETIDEIRKVLAKYFEEHSNGKKSKTYCSWFSAQDAIDEIADLVGEY